jgi:dipeptidyl aminopeptidase/acylaminoacyl peptidase
MRTAIVAWGLVCLPLVALAQAPATKTDPLSQDGYILPPDPIKDAVLAPWWKNETPGNYSPDGKYFAVLVRDGLPTLANLGRPHVNLAGLDVDTTARRARSLTTRNAAALKIVSLQNDSATTVNVANARITDPSWSPDGTQIAFLAHLSDRTEAWVYRIGEGVPHRVTAAPLLATAVNDLSWVDGNRLAMVLAPNSPAPSWPGLATSPKVAVSDPKKVQLRTFASLLNSPTEASQFEYYTTGQLALVDVATGKTQNVGKPAMIVGVDPSPDGRYFRVSVLERPFSYLYPYSSFPSREVIWDDKGEQKVELRKRGLQTSEEDRPKPTDRRAVAWRPDGRGLAFLQLESTDPKDTAKKARDRVMLWRPPFTDKDIDTVWSSDTRINSVQFSADANLLFVQQTVDGKSRLSLVRPRTLDRPVVLNEAKPDDTAVSLLTRPARAGAAVRISPDGSSAYFGGTTYAKDPMAEAPRPFVDRVSLADGKRARIFESRADVYETATVLDDAGDTAVVTRQSPSMVPNSYLLTLSTKAERRLTDNKDYAPDLTQARREWVPITRPDGLKFWAKVTLPANYVSGTRLPAFFWFYPSEFTGQEAYDRGRRTFNKNLFNGMSPSNKTALIRMGYALVEPDSPIIGTADRKNDSYVSNLRNDLSAIIDELDRKGFVDRTRLGIGGHSYGAFSTANAMVATPFFKAGIAGDGNYNRSLTPFGFQSEERQLWEGREVYLSMSPILYVDQITGALLMYHGLEDQNVGTTPINSERMFAALQANGKPAALYMYPYEDHGQIAQETILDQWARWVAWLDKYLRR